MVSEEVDGGQAERWRAMRSDRSSALSGMDEKLIHLVGRPNKTKSTSWQARHEVPKCQISRTSVTGPGAGPPEKQAVQVNHTLTNTQAHADRSQLFIFHFSITLSIHNNPLVYLARGTVPMHGGRMTDLGGDGNTAEQHSFAGVTASHAITCIYRSSVRQVKCTHSSCCFSLCT